MEQEGGKAKEWEPETFQEKLDFINTRFITGSKPIIQTQDVAKPGEESTLYIFGGDLYLGVLTDAVTSQIMYTLGVDLGNPNPDFKLTGTYEFDVFTVPKTNTETYLLVRSTEGTSEILFYEVAELEILEVEWGVERVYPQV